MSTSFPGALDALTNPAATDGLTGHAAQHANANNAIEALEAKVGVDNSTDPASLDYRVAAVETGKVDKAAGKQLSTEDYSTLEKQKLAGIAEGANAYTHPVSHAATMIIEDSAHRFVTDTQAAAWDSKAAGAHVGSGGTAHAAVTTSVDGFMSAADKVKLDAISGTNTGDQTSVTGNAGTATKLQTARTINGVSFDGSANITINAVDSTARIASSEKGAANGVAPLGADSKIAATYLPSYVDDVLEYANQAAFPATGETAKIYVALDTNKAFRWSGSAYVEISASPGSTDAVTEGSTNLYFTAQRVRDAVLTGLSTATNAVIAATDSVLVAFGKLQKQISGHLANLSNPHSVTKTQVGLGSCDNTADLDKPVSTAQATAIGLKENTVSVGTTAQFWRGDKAWTDFATTVRATVLTGLSLATGTAIAAADSILVAFGKLQKQITDNLSTLTTHTGNTSNPHSVTKAQVGLGSVDNTADLSKPISTATQSALNLKANLVSPAFTTPNLGAATATSLTLTTDLAVADGGTGRSTGTTAYALIATGTTATGAQQSLAAGLTTQLLVGGGASALPVWTTATGSGSPVRATSPTLVTPILGVATGTSFNSITGLSSTTPAMNGVAAVGTGTTTARGDHVHPTDTTRAPLASPTFTDTLTHSGDVVLNGSGKRITGDFSNATIANRLMFQTSTVNAASDPAILPNGTSTTSALSVFNNSDPTNAAFAQLSCRSSDVRIQAEIAGSGTHLPMTFYTGGAERMRIDTAGNVLITSPSGLGYGTGSGGTVTQQTSKSTQVTINRPSGRVTMHNAALASGQLTAFCVSNSTIVAPTVVAVGISGGVSDAGQYRSWAVCNNSGRFWVYLENRGAGALSEPVQIDFYSAKVALS